MKPLIPVISVRENQMPLRTQYKSSPEAALVTDHARTTGADPRDPFHATVELMDGCGVTVPVGVHAVLACRMTHLHRVTSCVQRSLRNPPAVLMTFHM